MPKQEDYTFSNGPVISDALNSRFDKAILFEL